MKEHQYIKVAKLTDEILMSQSSSPARVAIPWMHVIREHPEFLRSYESLFFSDETLIDYFKNYKSFLRKILSLMYVILKSIFSSNSRLWSKTIQKLPEIDVIFVSHLLNKSQYYNKDDDFYFSNLPSKIIQCGYSALTVLLNHTGKELFNRSNRSNNNSQSRLVLPSTMSFLKELKNLMILWIEYRDLRKQGFIENNLLKKKYSIWLLKRPYLGKV